MLGVKRILPGRRWSRLVLVVGSATAIAAGAWCCRATLVHRAAAQQTTQTPVTEATASAPLSDYTTRVVAYIHSNQAVTRQELGEYLINRHGAEKLPVLLNKRLIDEECRKRGLVINAAEVDATLAEDIRNMGIDQDTFIKTVLPRSKKNLYEFKEDVIRPRIQMTRLVQDRLQVDPEDLKKAYESAYGEKVECRLIMWPKNEHNKALAAYGRLRSSEAAFSEAARTQAKPELAATGGKLKPICRHVMAKELEDAAFGLQPGELSTIKDTPDGLVVLRCDKRIPPDTSVKFESVKEKLAAEIRAGKLQNEMAKLFNDLRQQAKPEVMLTSNPKVLPTAVPPANAVVAYLHGNQPVTREELGEFLIARFGSEKVEFLVNRRIIDGECISKGVAVSEADIDHSMLDDFKLVNCKSKEAFEKDYLLKWGKSMFEWREDVVRPRLMLAKLCEGRVKCTDEDVKKAYEAYHGERLECRMIVWPTDQVNYARKEYITLRDSETEFDRKARSQPLPHLASKGGRIDTFGRHVLGDDKLEQEAFRLQPGETSALIETPQGVVMIRCDKRIPADKNVSLEQVRKERTEEILQKKVQLEMQVVFKEMRERAKPQIILKWFGQTEDLAGDSRKLLADLPPLTAQKK